MEPGEALSAAGQIAVALAGFAGVVVAFRSRRRLLEIGPTVIERTQPRYAFYLITLLVMAAGLLQIYNALFSGVFWIFYTIVIYALAVAGLQFARMIFQPPDIGQA